MRFTTKGNLPFFPSYNTEVQGSLKIWWFAKEFSQSRYNYKNAPCGSNACTIITVLLAAKFHYDEIEVLTDYDYLLPAEIVQAFAESVLEGNELHDKLRMNGMLENINLTVPEAIESAGNKLEQIAEWRSVLYMVDLELTLFKHLKLNLSEWYRTPYYRYHPDLYIILIADHRSVLFVSQESTDTISVFDSHQHMAHGALIAQVPKIRLKLLCQWFCNMLSDCFNSHPNCYELSFLYFKKRSRNVRSSC